MKYDLLDIISEPVELGVAARTRIISFKKGLFNLNCKMTFSEFAVTTINSYRLIISLKYYYQLLLLRTCCSNLKLQEGFIFRLFVWVGIKR